MSYSCQNLLDCKIFHGNCNWTLKLYVDMIPFSILVYSHISQELYHSRLKTWHKTFKNTESLKKTWKPGNLICVQYLTHHLTLFSKFNIACKILHLLKSQKSCLPQICDLQVRANPRIFTSIVVSERLFFRVFVFAPFISIPPFFCLHYSSTEWGAVLLFLPTFQFQ